MSPLSQKERENALNEVRILASIRHPNVIGYKEAFIEDSELVVQARSPRDSSKNQYVAYMSFFRNRIIRNHLMETLKFR